MKFSYNWLQSYFETPLPKPKDLAKLITFHALEVEGLEKAHGDTIIEIAILPNRAHDCLSYEGMAKELGVLLGMDIKKREVSVIQESETAPLFVYVDDEKLCRRYMGRVVEGIKIKQSPKWLRDRLQSAGQRPINNIVDIMNFVMLETGQPLHAFDADLLAKKENDINIFVRKAKAGETITTLDGKELALSENTLVIADPEAPLAIAGIKGGTKAEISEATKNIVIEAANFAPGNIRKTSRAVGIRNDSSIRFENEITAKKAEEAMAYAVSLLFDCAAGKKTKAGKTVDVYLRKMAPYKIGITTDDVNRILGTSFEKDIVAGFLERFHFDYIESVPREEIAKNAEKLEGVPYKIGASISYDAPASFDCSSLIGYLYSQAGIAAPRMSVDLYAWAEKIEKDDMLPGDIVFSNTGEGVVYYETMEWLKGTKIPEGVDHCGLYLGTGRVIHATRKEGKVVIEKLSESERFKNIVGYGRCPKADESRFVVSVPAERLDLRRKEDVVEEIGRIHGYEKIAPAEPSREGFAPAVNKRLFYAQKARSVLAKSGFSEVSTYAFVDSGEVEMENPIAADKKFLRRDLVGGILRALELNSRNAPLLGRDIVKIFEIGTVFENGREYVSLCLGAAIPGPMKKKDETIKNIIFDAETKLAEALHVSVIGETPAPALLLVDLDALIAKAPEQASYEFPEKPNKEKRYKKISPYPFVLRDIAVFVPSDIKENGVLKLIKQEAGKLLATAKLFDVFVKTFEDGTKKTSYAFRLVFQSPVKTLSDEEVNEVMNKVTATLNGNEGWKVR